MFPFPPATSEGFSFLLLDKIGYCWSLNVAMPVGVKEF